MLNEKISLNAVSKNNIPIIIKTRAVDTTLVFSFEALRFNFYYNATLA